MIKNAIPLIMIIAMQALSEQIQIRIVHEIGRWMTEEYVIFTIRDKKADIHVTREKTYGYIDVFLPGPGLYPCIIETKTKINGKIISGYLEGHLNVKGGEIVGIDGVIDNGKMIIKVVVRGTLPGYQSRAGRYDNNYDNGYDNGYYYGQGEDNYGGGQNYGDYYGGQQNSPSQEYYRKKGQRYQCEAECSRQWMWCNKAARMNMQTSEEDRRRYRDAVNQCEYEKRRCEQDCREEQY